MTSKSQFYSNIKEIKLHKFGTFGGNADYINCIDITPLYLECNIYQSLFEPLIKSEIVINDSVGLFVNFPLTGEEIVELSYEETYGNKTSKTLYLVIDSITDVVANDRGRSLLYKLNLISYDAYFNNRIKVSHAYNDLISNIVPNIYEEYISREVSKTIPFITRIKPFITEVTDEARLTIIPNLRPLNAIDWLRSQAISQNKNNYFYLFYETVDGFRFRTIQELLNNTAIRNAALSEKYMYYSDNIIGEMSKNIDTNKIISRVEYNKRYSTIGKIDKGYFQSSYVDLNLFQKSYRIKNFESEDITSIEKYKLNTDGFIQATKFSGNTETDKNRVKYIVNSKTNTDVGYTDITYGERWMRGQAAMAAFSSIDYHITIPQDTRKNVGNFINCEFPEMHGYNQIGTDKYISGLFIISEIKHIFTPGNVGATVLRINKDSYGDNPAKPSEYGSGNLR